MNLDQMLNMFMRLVGRKLMSRGIDAGFDRIAGKSKAKDDMTPQERQAAGQIKQAGKRAQQAARLSRRVGKF